MAEFAERVLGLLAQASYRPITLKAMSRRLEVQPDDYPEFRSVVKSLIRDGKLHLARDKTTQPARPVGHDRRAFSPVGQGFRICSSSRCRPRRRPDLHSAGGHARRLEWRRSRVKITRPARRGGASAEGRIVEVLARAAEVFVGTYFEAGDTSFVKVDGTTFREPISVGDPGAKGRKPGDKVVLEIVRYPTPYRDGEGVIVEILGQRGQPGVDTLSVIRAFNIPDTFDEAVLEEAREQAQLFDEAEIGARLDLRDLPTVTIDPATARDFDDAISLSRREGHWTPGGPHRRRRALRSIRHRRWTAPPGTGARASTCPTASSPCFPRSSRTAWPASRPVARVIP